MYELTLISSDGDVVVIRVNETTNELDIKDNHAPDSSIGSTGSISSFPELENESTEIHF